LVSRNSEADNEDIKISVSQVFEELGEKPRLEVQPVKVTLSSSSIVLQIL
jgi:hypothetical protein